MITATIEMSPTMRTKLSAISVAFGGSAMNAPLMAGAQIVANDARTKAPVLSGTLRRSIGTEVISSGVVAVGTSVPYARRIEMGFEGADKRGRVYHQAAKPYLRPALDQNRDAVLQAIAAATQDLLRRA